MHGKKSLLLELQSQLHARVIACQLGNGIQCGRGSGKRSDLLDKGEKLVGRKRELKLIAGNGDIGSDKSSAQAGTKGKGGLADRITSCNCPAFDPHAEGGVGIEGQSGIAGLETVCGQGVAELLLQDIGGNGSSCLAQQILRLKGYSGLGIGPCAD